MHRGIGAVIVGIVAVALGLLAHASEVNAQSSQSSRQAEVTKCWASPPRVETGDSVTVKATVKNNSAGVFSAKLHVVFDIYPPSGGKYPFEKLPLKRFTRTRAPRFRRTFVSMLLESTQWSAISGGTSQIGR